MSNPNDPVNAVSIPYDKVPLLRKCVNTIKGYGHFTEGQDGWAALEELDQFVLSLEDQNDYPYGVCPHCRGKGIQRERRPNGNDTCSQGHVYPSRSSVPV